MSLSQATSVVHEVLLSEADASETERRFLAIVRETNAEGVIGLALARLAAVSSVEMERGADQRTAALSERLRQVRADFVAPSGADADEAERLLSEASRRAMFDPSKEAAQARKVVSGAERTFLRCVKDLERRDKAARKVARAEVARPAPIVPKPVVVLPDPVVALPEPEVVAPVAKVQQPAPAGGYPMTDAQLCDHYAQQQVPSMTRGLPFPSSFDRPRR